MHNYGFSLIPVLALICVSCGRGPVAPSPIQPPAPAISSVKMVNALPEDGGTLAYGSISEVAVHYTVANELRDDLIYGGVIILSCLSTDGQNIIRDSCAGRLVHDQSGTVINDPGLDGSYRTRISQTRFVVIQLRLYRDDSVVVSVPNSIVWNFQ